MGAIDQGNLESFFKLLARLSPVIDLAYTEKVLLESSENAEAIRELEKLRVIYGDGTGRFFLKENLRGLIESSFRYSSDNPYRIIDKNAFAPLLDQLMEILPLGENFPAFTTNVENINRRIYEIRNDIEWFIQDAKTSTDENFLMEKTLEEAEFTVGHYIKKLEKMSELISNSVQNDFFELAREHQKFEPVLFAFNHHISAETKTWNDYFIETTGMITKHMHKIRKKSQNSRRVKKLFEFFRKRTNWIPTEEEIPYEEFFRYPWANRVFFPKIKAYTDISDVRWIETVSVIAQKTVWQDIKKQPSKKDLSEKVERFLEGYSDEEETSGLFGRITLYSSAIMECIEDLVQSRESVSVLEWKDTRSDLDEVKDDTWLLCIWFYANKLYGDQCKIVESSLPVPSWSNSIIVTDLLLSARE